MAGKRGGSRTLGVEEAQGRGSEGVSVNLTEVGEEC
jgi:hypothetical protein